MSQKKRCEKKRFRDQAQATAALRRITANPHQKKPRQPQRVYQCPRCKGYHLTSMSLDDHFAKDQPP